MLASVAPAAHARAGSLGRRSWTRSVLAACWAAALAASGCSGGGSGSGGGGLAVSPSTASFAAPENGALPATKALAVTVTNGDAAYIGAAFVGSTPPWASIALLQSGTTWSLRVAITTTALPPGSYAATVRVGIAKADQTILATQDVQVQYTVSARLAAGPATLAFSAFEAGAGTAAQALSVTGTGFSWTATASDGWLVLANASGTGPGTVQVSADPGALAPGDYTGTITVQAAGATPVQVTATLHVEAAAFTVEPQLAFSGTNGAVLPTQALHLALNGGGAIAWTATASEPWIVLDHAAGTTSDTVAVGVDPSQGPLASGSHAGTVTFGGTVGGRAITATVGVTLSLAKATLTLQPTSLVLGGPVGRDLTAQQVSLSLDTGAPAYAWTASSAQSWIVPGAASGSVSGTPVAVSVGPDAAGLAGGSHDGALDFSVAVNGDVVTATLPVRLDLDDHHLVVSDTGVAFAKTPSRASLTRTLQVRDDFGLATSWTATSSAGWLSATPSGTTPGELVLTADPTGLAADATYSASVTVVPGDPSVGGSETIQVGLWVGATDPATASVDVEYTAIATDPVRPYAYVHAGGTDLTVYNVYTAQVVRTIASVAAQLGALAVAPDGSTLYAVDRTNFRIVPVDLATFTVGTSFPVGAAVAPSLHATRTNGKGLLLAGNRCIYDPGTGAALYPAGGCTSTTSYATSASVLGNIFSIDATAYRLDYTAVGGGTVVVGAPLFANIAKYNSADYAFNPDGTRMYLAVGSPYDFYVVDTTVAGTLLPLVQTLPGEAYPSNVEVTKDGRAVCANETYADAAGHDAWVYSPEGVLLKPLYLSYLGVRDGLLKVSGDGLRLVAIADGSYPSVYLVFDTTVP